MLALNNKLSNTCSTDDKVASVSWLYPNVGVYVFSSLVVGKQQLVSNPLTLTVGKTTTLSLNVGSPDSNFNFPVSGSLLYNGKAIANKQITLKVNGTAAASVNTNSSGCYTTTLKLKPINNNATVYQLEAAFYGDNALNYTLKDTAPDGTEYALCTTLYYYGFKPSANTTTLTVDPKSTQLTSTTKTPEQLQAEAQDSGWLSIWHEFSWWYPWYRLHYISIASGTKEYDIGNSLLPLADTVWYANSLIQRIESFLPDVVWSIASAIAGADFCALLASSISGPVGFFIPLGISLGFKWAALSLNWNNIGGLVSAYVGSLFSTIFGLAKDKFRLIGEIVDLVLGIKSLAEFGWGKLYRIVSIPINVVYQCILLGRIKILQAAG